MTTLRGQEAEDFDILKFFQDQAVKPGKLGTNSSVAVYRDGTIKYKKEMGCHAYVSEFIKRGFEGDYNLCTDVFNKPSPLESIYTSLWSHTYDDSDLEYFRFILNETYSPWKDHIKGREVLWGEKDGKKIPVAFKLVDMNASTQVVMNLFLASRILYAQPGLARAYKAFREAGFTRTEATFLSANVGLNHKDTFSWPYLGDFPYDTAFTNMSWKRWSDRSPRFNKTKILSNSSDYSPCNAIWNRANVSSGIQIANDNENTLKNTDVQDLVSEIKEVKNIFGKSEKIRVPMKKEQGIAALKSSMEQWKWQGSTSPAESLTEATPILSTGSSLNSVIVSYAPPLSNSTALYSTDLPSGFPLSSTANVPSASSSHSI